MLDFKDIVIDKLAKQKLTLAIAESVTGGAIASTIVGAPGASVVFKGGVVAYSKEAKIRLLNVRESTIAQHGVISAQVAKEMAIGVVKQLNTDIGLGVTGVAGPETVENRAVGTVFFCVVVIDKAYEFEAQFNDEGRNKNRISITSKILEELLKIVVKLTKSKE